MGGETRLYSIAVPLDFKRDISILAEKTERPAIQELAKCLKYFERRRTLLMYGRQKI